MIIPPWGDWKMIMTQTIYHPSVNLTRGNAIYPIPQQNYPPLVDGRTGLITYLYPKSAKIYTVHKT